MSSRRHYGAIRKLPSGRYQARYRNGAGSLVPAPDTFATKGDAQRWLSRVEADQQRGTFIDPAAGRITVAAWAEGWLRTKRASAPTRSLAIASRSPTSCPVSVTCPSPV